MKTLHQAHLELCQSRQQLHHESEARQDKENVDEQKDQMENLVRKLEAKYKAQMNDQIKKIRYQVEDRPRAKMESELAKNLNPRSRGD